MRFHLGVRLVCVLCTTLFSSVACFAKVVHGLPSPQSSATKKSLRAHAAWDKREVDAPFIKSSAQIPLPPSRKNNVFSFFTFSWVRALMEVGNKKTLELSDLWVLEENQLMANASLSLDNQFNIEKQRAWDPAASHRDLLSDFWFSPLTRAVLKQYKRQLLESGILKLLNTLVQFIPSLLIARILKHVDKAAAARTLFSTAKFTLIDREGMVLALALYGTLCVKTFLENQYFDAIIAIGATARGSISSAIFRKSLKLSPAGRQNNTMGEIVNYMQLDTSRMESVIGTLHVCWDGPLQVLGYTALLLKFLGPSVLAGIAAMLVIIPFNAIYLKKLSALRAINLKYTDSRVKLTNEILQGVRAIKSYNWEKPFVEKLTAVRDLELNALEASANTRAILTSVLTAAPSMVAVITLGTYGLLGNVLTPTKVFTALALFNQLRFPLVFLPLLLNNLAEGRVSLYRLTKFLLTDEVQDYVQRKKESDIVLDNISSPGVSGVKDSDAILIEQGSFSWNSDPDSHTNNDVIKSIDNDGVKTTVLNGVQTGAIKVQNGVDIANRGVLSNVNLRIKKGELVAIIGSVGSGKSTLLSALLGELNRREGKVYVDGSVAYIPQSAWIPNDSLKNVVMFGRKMDREKYDETIEACGLTKDLQQLEGGDETEIGERGVNLSGGQKQRVSIARAVYDNADIYLFDDPLSALDAEVGANLFNNCIKGVLHEKTRVLVTHQLRVLPEVDRVIVMGDAEDGSATILAQGTLNELLALGYDLSKLVRPAEEVIERKKEEKDLQEKEKNDLKIEKKEHMEQKEQENDLTSIHTSVDQSISESLQASHGVATATVTEKVESEDSPTSTLFSSSPSYTAAAASATSSPSSSSIPTITSPSPLDSFSSFPITSSIPTTSSPATSTSTSDPNSVERWEEFEKKLSERKRKVENDIEMKKNLDMKKESEKEIKAEGIEVEKGLGQDSIDLNLDGEKVENIEKVEKVEKAVVKLMTLEERGEGAIGWGVYRSYFKSASKPWLLVALLFSFILGNTSQIFQQWIVAAWTSDVGYVKRPLGVYLGGVALMAFSVTFFNWARTLLGVLVGTSASRTIHRNMARQVLGAPLGFFESTPVGRLIQRFSKDLDQIDQQLPSSLGQLLSSSIAIAASMIAITVVTPAFLLAMLPIFGVYIAVTNYYRNVARELKRLESLSRSPIYAHFSETLGGLPVIRSFDRQGMYQRVNEVKLDDNIAAYYSMKAVDRWLSVRLEVLGNTIVFASALLAVFSASRAGSAGISLNNALSVTSLLNWAVRNGAETESLMNSVERVEYTTNMTPQERPSTVDSIPPSAFTPTSAVPQVYQDYLTNADHLKSESDMLLGEAESDHRLGDGVSQRYLPASDSELVESGWPWKGGITLEGVEMRYREDFEPVLRGVTFQITPGSSVGIVGRTGSGKSSLFRGLLRLTELERGAISVDGVDVAAVGLDALRSGVSIIPQDPVLFSGSIRLNLDPFNTHSDDTLWSALKKSNLDRTVLSLPEGLGYEVTEGGENFSSGQRQLLCLARALVRRSRILLLDEATSSVDFETDALIQQTIRDEFGGGRSTVLTIAHRLDTIMDADMILVMDAGRVGEFGPPAELLKNPKSLFSQLIAAERLQDQKTLDIMSDNMMNDSNCIEKEEEIEGIEGNEKEERRELERVNIEQSIEISMANGNDVSDNSTISVNRIDQSVARVTPI